MHLYLDSEMCHATNLGHYVKYLGESDLSMKYCVRPIVFFSFSVGIMKFHTHMYQNPRVCHETKIGHYFKYLVMVTLNRQSVKTKKDQFHTAVDQTQPDIIIPT